jgi:hypothetical protein
MGTPTLRVSRLLVVAPLVLAVACGGQHAAGPGPAAPRVTLSAPSAAPSTPRPNPAPIPPPRPRADLGERLSGTVARAEPGTTLGAVVYDRTTGTSPIEYNAGRPFRSASLVKLLIAIDVLERGADAADRERIARMLTVSDDVLANAYWVRLGGPSLVTRTSAALGLVGVRPPDIASQWGEVVVTPRDLVAIYRHLLELPPADRALLVGALERAPRQAADGFDQHFGIPDGLDTAWAVKQGWGSNDRAMVLHSTGLVGPGLRYVVVLLTEHPLGAGWARGAQAVTAAAGALRTRLPGI